MRAACRHGGSATRRRWGWGGGLMACGSVESYGIYSIFYSCVLVFRADPCWNMSICMVFARQEANNTVFTVFLLVFRKAFLSGRSNPMFFYRIIHLFTAPARCVYLCFCASRAEKPDFCGVLAGLEKANFPVGQLSSAALFSCPVSACYFDSVGWDASSKTSPDHKPSLQDLKPQALRYCAATCVLLAQVVT